MTLNVLAKIIYRENLAFFLHVLMVIFFYIDKSKVQCLFSWSDKFWKATNGQQRPEQTSKDKTTQAKTSKEKQWQAKTSKDKQRQAMTIKDKQRAVVLSIMWSSVKFSLTLLKEKIHKIIDPVKSKNHTFRFYTLPNSFNIALFQSYTLPVLHSSNPKLFQS